MIVEFEISDETLETLRAIANGADPENNEALQQATYEVLNRTIMCIAAADKNDENTTEPVD